MRKPVNSEIDLIRAIWSRTNLNEGVKADVKAETGLFGDMSAPKVKGGKRGKVAEKSGPTRGMGEPEPTPVDLVANSRAAKPSELVHEPLPEVAEIQAAGRSREQAIAATEAPATGMNAMQKMVDDMVNFSGRRGLGKREMNKVWNGTASTASPVANINDIPTPLSTSNQSVNPDYKVTSDVSSVSKPINVPAGLPEVKPIDPNWRNNLLNLGKPQAMLTSDKPTAVNWKSTTINTPSAEPVPEKSLAVVSKQKPNEDPNNNSLVKNLAQLALLSAASYGVTKKITDKETPVADKTVNTPVVSPVADNDSEYYYPDTFVGRKKQEITEYYRQALVQKLEEASAAFWAVQGAGATRKQLNSAEKRERADKLAPFEKIEPNKYPVKNMPVKDEKKTVESEPLKREDRFQFPNDPVTRNEFTLGRLATATSAPSGPKIQQPLIPSSMLQGLEGRMKAAGQWLAGETTETTLPSGEIKQVRRGAPLLDSDKIAATEIKKKLMAMKSRRAQPTTQAPKETFDAEGVDMTVELPNLPKLSPSRQSQIGINLERELAKAHGTVEEPKEHAGDDIDDDTAIDTELPSYASHAKREDASKSTAVRILSRLYPASSRVSDVGDISPVSAENPPDNTSLAQLKIDAKSAKQRKSHTALQNIYSDLFARHTPDVATPKSENLPVEPVSTGRTDVSSTTSWPQLVAQQLAPNWEKAKVPFKDEHTPTGRLRKKPLHPVRQALNQVRLSEPHTFAALLPHVDDATKTSLQQHMDYLAKNSARDVETPKSDVGTLLKNISRF